jgi:hypothetical protein
MFNGIGWVSSVQGHRKDNIVGDWKSIWGISLQFLLKQCKYNGDLFLGGWGFLLLLVLLVWRENVSDDIYIYILLCCIVIKVDLFI